MAATKLEHDLISLKTGVKVLGWVLGILIPGLGFWGWYVTTNIIAMKQQLADGGNAKLVAELKSPKSTEQLQANLTTVVAQVATARANDKAPNPQKVKALSSAIAQVVQKNPNLQEAWQAAAQVVSFRTAVLPIPQDLPPCDTVNSIPVEKWRAPSSNMAQVLFGYFYHHCTLDLSKLPPQDAKGHYQLSVIDNGSWGNDTSEHIIPLHLEPGGDSAQLPIFLNDGIVTASEGSITPGNKTFVFTNCRFNFSLQTPPEGPLRELLQAALEKPDLATLRIGQISPLPAG